MDNSKNLTNLRAAMDGGRWNWKRLPPWGIFALGLVGGLLSVHLCITRPLTRELARLGGQIETLQRGMRDLAAHKGHAAKTNELLGMLAEQGRQSEVAAEALSTIQSLNDSLIRQKGSAEKAQEIVASLAEVQSGALDLHADAQPIIDALDKMAVVQQRVVEQYGSILSAQDTLAELIRLREMAQAEATQVGPARQSLEALIDLKGAALAEAEQLSAAAGVVESWMRLNDRINRSAPDVQLARDTTEELLALRDTILCGSDMDYPHPAREVLDEMIRMRDRLQSAEGDVAAAHSRLDGLVDLKDQVVAQTTDLADAVETLETAAELHRQFDDAVHSFDQVRRWMADIVLMEPMIERAMAALRPLVDLGNLRRLDPAELREAARVIAANRQNDQKSEKQAEVSHAPAGTLAAPLGAGEID